MKNKNLISILVTIWFFFTNTNKITAEKLGKSESLIVKTELETFEQEKFDKTNKKLQKLIDDLNTIKIYVLVTTPLKNEDKEDILISLISEARLDAEQHLIDYRHRKLLLTRSSSQPIRSRREKYSIEEILRSNRFLVNSKTYRNAKSYSIDNSCGYKSICPIFFDKFSAENFLIKSSRRTILMLRTLPIRSNKETFNGMFNARIKLVHLGDFMEYMTRQENENIFDKFEFLFVPYLSQFHNLTPIEKRRINKIIKTKNFRVYQEEFLELQKNIE